MIRDIARKYFEGKTCIVCDKNLEMFIENIEKTKVKKLIKILEKK